ncbi:MAG: PQQ-binding-like beta-propeller repeat protein, partial [Verrucomicrobiota bacterium]
IAAEGQSPPTSWGDGENVLWKASIPGRGHSTPIVVGDQVLLTTCEESSATQSVLSYDRATGAPRWKKDLFSGETVEKVHKKNTHASSTLASDGQSVFALFHNKSGLHLTALRLDGSVTWQKKVGDYLDDYNFGYGPSPLLHGDHLIIASEYTGGGFLAAFHKDNGSEVWRAPRKAMTSYSSPIVAEVAGREQLLLSGSATVSSYDPSNGKLLWQVPLGTKVTCGTMVWDGDLVFASGGYPTKETIAVNARTGKTLWTTKDKTYEQSMITLDGHLYTVNDNGIAICWRGEDGKELWKERLEGPVSASPTLANGLFYAASESGTWFVYQASPKGINMVAEFSYGDEAFASPVIVDSQIFLRIAEQNGGRREEFLVCVGT